MSTKVKQMSHPTQRRGPRPKPLEMEELEGNPGKKKMKNKLVGEKQQTAFQSLDIPPEIKRSAITMEKWAFISHHCRLWLKESDRDTVLQYCLAYKQYILATREIEKEGITITNAQGNLMKHPALAAQAEASNKMLKFGPTLGLDPASRMQLYEMVADTKKGNDSDEDSWDNILN